MRKRIVGPHAMDFKTEACVIVKQNTPLEYARWKDIPKEIKLKLWMGMKQKFNLEEDYQVKDVVYAQLNRQYRNYRHKLHAHYLKRKGEGEILDQSPDGVTRDDWKQLIDYFESDHFKKMSDRNKKNRQNLTMAHSCGTKSIAQYCYEERNNETGDEPTRTAAWRMSRFNSKKKEWTDEASRVVYDELLRLQTEPIGDGEYPLEEDEAFVKVLGEEKSSRLRGCGDGLKPPSKRGERVNFELQKENEGLRKQNEAMSSRLESLEAQVGSQESQMQAQVEALLKAQLPAILQGLSQNHNSN